MLPVITPSTQQGTWGGNIQMTPQVTEESVKESATFKANGNPYKDVAL